MDDRGIGVRFPAGERDVFFPTASRLALGPTQLPIQWVPGGGSFPRGKAARGVKVVPRLRMLQLYPHPLIHLHGVLFK
jgi:hypothetical protein